MARRLLSSGFPVAVYNRNTDKAAPFANTGRLRRRFAAGGGIPRGRHHQHGRR